MRRVVDPLVLATLIALAGLVYYAGKVSGFLAIYLLICYAALWGAVIIAIRGSVRGDELRKRAKAFKDQGRSYHRFNKSIMLIAFGPLAMMLLVLVVILALTLQ